VLGGRYEIMDQLGSGQHGDVFKVWDRHMDEISALKLIRDSPRDAWKEAQTLRQLGGDYVLRVRNADLAAGAPYVVTEVAENGTIDAQIVDGVGTPVALAVRWIRQACQGIAQMHDLGLLHRDIKPENLFLTATGDAQVGDVGLAHLQDIHGHAPAAGTISTMAPEVAGVVFGPPVETYEVRSDVYSLGATAFWMLAGERPLPLAVNHHLAATATAPDLWDRAPHVPRSLRDAINKALSFHVDDRFQSAHEFDAALGGKPIPARRWDRVKPHVGHEQCFVGQGKGPCIQVCALPDSRPTAVQINSSYIPSGRRIARATSTAPRRQLPQALRGTFRACDQ
jgi:serine/threonine-protein kinase